jgi:hypothetical protein
VVLYFLLDFNLIPIYRSCFSIFTSVASLLFVLLLLQRNTILFTHFYYRLFSSSIISLLCKLMLRIIHILIHSVQLRGVIFWNIMSWHQFCICQLAVGHGCTFVLHVTDILTPARNRMLFSFVNVSAVRV